jgi:hypothetical protein
MPLRTTLPSVFDHALKVFLPRPMNLRVSAAPTILRPPTTTRERTASPKGFVSFAV